MQIQIFQGSDALAQRKAFERKNWNMLKAVHSTTSAQCDITVTYLTMGFMQVFESEAARNVWEKARPWYVPRDQVRIVNGHEALHVSYNYIPAVTTPAV